MANSAAEIARHYGSVGLAERILAAIAEDGSDVAALTPEKLYPLDQLHGREFAATKEHLAKLELGPASHVLDVGSGIGGPARYMAAAYGCRVAGIDLTEEFVATARELTARCGLADRVTFHHGDALAMPFADLAFDAVSCLYVAMNIADRPALLRQIARVLKTGGRLVWTEAVEGTAGKPHYPLPWARDTALSFLVTAEALRTLIEGSGLRIVEWTEESETLKAFAAEMRGVEQPTAKRLTNQVVLGPDFMDRLRNFNRSIGEGRLGSVLVVAERP